MHFQTADQDEFSSEDHGWMLRALEVAQSGMGFVEPNPMVGCVLVAGGQPIGEGFHEAFGGPHAERAALSDAQVRGNAHELKNATAYVTLEPCCHHGKTPPCTDALIQSGVKRVVVAMFDPFEKVRGQGVAALQRSGIQVQVGLEQSAAEFLNAPYLKRIRSGRPWVIAKWAMSLDGKIATRTGNSKWISSETSRGSVQQLRSRVDGILVGSGTALADDPMLAARVDGPPSRKALRIVADTNLRLQVDSQLVRTSRDWPTLLWAGPTADPAHAKTLRDAGCEVEICSADDPLARLDELLQFLVKKYQATNLLVEGGGKLLGSFMELRQIDQCEVFIAPKLIGGLDAASPLAGIGIAQLTDGPHCISLTSKPSGADIYLSCRLQWTDESAADVTQLS